MSAENIYQQLIRLGRERRRPGDEMITLYGLERVLSRLAQTRFVNDFSLKGGVLLAAFSMRRPTRDIDMQALEFTLDEAHMRDVLRTICDVEADDGLVFNLDDLRIEEIRDEEEYRGLRVHLPAFLHRARLMIKLDVSTGDPIWPAPKPVTLPGILGDDVHLMGNPLETVIAEKVVTILQRGSTSTRWRDYMDIRSIARAYAFTAGELWIAAKAVGDFRGVKLESISPYLADYDDAAQGKWVAWRRKGQLEELCLPTLRGQLAEIVAFIDPVLVGTQTDDSTWNPYSYSWGSDSGAE